MGTHDEDLDLLLSLQERVLESPPESPEASLHSHGYLSDNDDSDKHKKEMDLSIFKEAVKDCFESAPIPPKRLSKKNPYDEPFIEKNSGLRLRNLTVSKAEVYERFADTRFVRLSSIKNMLMGDTVKGCWATVGVLVEKGNKRTSNAGKSYCIWKIGCLEENTVSLFLFGSSYEHNKDTPAGTALALLSCNVRKDSVGDNFSLSAYSPNQVLIMGCSVDYGVCKGRRKDGTPCTSVINKRRGAFCSYHKTKTSEQYSSTRMELMGGNLKTAFRDRLKWRGIHVVEPLSGWKKSKNLKKAATVLSVDGLKRALSKADQVTTNKHSQGIRFLNQVAAELQDKETPQVKRRASHATGVSDHNIHANLHQHKKKKMIEIELFNSDDDM